MCGSQFGFIYNNHLDLNGFISNIITRLSDTFELYDISNDQVVLVQVSFRKLDSQIINELYLSDSLASNMDLSNRQELSVPVSIDENTLGTKLKTLSDKGFINYIELPIKGKYINFYDYIVKHYKFLSNKHINNIGKLDSGFSFYLVLASGRSYVLAVRVGKDYIEKIKFHINGSVLGRIVDKYLKDGSVIRTLGKSNSIIKDNKVVFTENMVLLKALEKSKPEALFISNPNIGVIDTETYRDVHGISKIYALGFRTNLDKRPVTYYIDKDTLNSTDLVVLLLDELLRKKYDKIKYFYCHNLSGYDMVFLIKIISELPSYKVSCIFIDNKVIRITITSAKDSSNKISLVDSLLMLNDSLHNLGLSFEVDTLKSVFPYKFANKDTLFYIGNTPDINFYKNI